MTIHAITLRRARPSDAVALQSHFRALSKASRYNRFLGTVSDTSIADIDRTIGGGGLFCVIATRQTGNSHQIVAESVCAAISTAKAAAAEIAMSVNDAVQGCGIGRALLTAMEALAAQRGARALYGTTLSDNDRIRKLASSLGYDIERSDRDWNHLLLRKTLASCNHLPLIASPTTVTSPLAWAHGTLGRELGRE